MKEIPVQIDVVTAKHRSEFGEAYDLLKFVSEDRAREARTARNEILHEIEGDISFRNRKTKPVYLGISPGCALCGEGSWSCLFISGKCNCKCFYCPSEQKTVGVPSTNSLTFPNSQDYVDYLGKFNFKGVSLSGGEPLLTPATTLRFLKAVKKRFGDQIHLWIYTNGTLVDSEILGRLRDAGLDEIRFDIGATGYSLKKAKMAVGVIDTVTVEIPAVPEDFGLLKDKTQEMAESGISYLNLHQLRLTPFNLPKLIERQYTYLHGDHPTVLESELTALRLMQYASRNHIPLAINYCSYVYKNRFQRAAARRRCGQLIRRSFEDITENGYIRSLLVSGPADILGVLAYRLEQSGLPSEKWHLTNERDQIFLSSDLWSFLKFERIQVLVAYSDSRFVSSISYRNPFKEIELNRNRSIFVERSRISDYIEIPENQLSNFEALITGTEQFLPGDFEAPLREIIQYEMITSELQDYS